MDELTFNSILYTYWAPYVTLVSIYQANIAGHTKKYVLLGPDDDYRL